MGYRGSELVILARLFFHVDLAYVSISMASNETIFLDMNNLITNIR